MISLSKHKRLFNFGPIKERLIHLEMLSLVAEHNFSTNRFVLEDLKERLKRIYGVKTDYLEIHLMLDELVEYGLLKRVNDKLPTLTKLGKQIVSEYEDILGKEGLI